MAFFPSDPEFGAQRFLHDQNGLDLNVVDVWDDYTGEGIQVVVHDVGYDYTHEDLGNYRTDLDYDFADDDFDAAYIPDPNPFDRDDTGAHGTPIMGIIGASQNSVGGVGIAFDAELIGYRRGGTSVWDDALTLATDRNHDVISMSHGLFDGRPFDPDEANGSEAFIMSTDVQNAIDALRYALQNGRTVDGVDRGMIVVKSAGNARANPGSEWREETPAEALDGHRGTITVAGIDRDDGFINAASSPGASVLISSFYYTDFTTDNVGVQGYNETNTTDFPSIDYTDFAGTSASAPQISGIVALMLEANETLGWRDVQTILSYSARHTGSSVGQFNQQAEQATFGNASWAWNAANDWNGGGLHISNDYGFGLVDAKAAVRLAEMWRWSRHSGNDVTTVEDGLDEEVWISPLNIGFTRTFEITETSSIDIEHVTLGIDFTEWAVQDDLEIFLTSPGGTRIQIISRTGDEDGYTGRWNFGATGFRGEDSAGTWTVEVRDVNDGIASPIRIDNIVLRTWGAPDNDNDHFIFTNEFSDYAGTRTHGIHFAGGAGTDTLNAAAVDDSASVINLTTGQGTLDGVDITMTSIERVYTGDGNDTVVDGAGAEQIYTGRGDDTVVESTSGGADTYHLGAGDDTITVFSNVDGDTFHGHTGNDTINFTFMDETGATFDLADQWITDANGNQERMTGFQNLHGTQNADTIIDGDGPNEIHAQGGDDTVIVTSLINLDHWDGGDGFNDLIDWSRSEQIGGLYDLDAGIASNSFQSETMRNFEDLIGTDQDDTVVESAAINEIELRAGNDTLIVTTSIFGDAFDGGHGVDLIDWSGSSQDGGTYDLGAGTAVIGSFSEVMERFENIIGTGQDDIIIESLFANEIDAGGGDDVVEVITGIGVDSFIGGFGNDTIDWSGSNEEDGVYDISGGTATSADGTDSEVMFGFENFIGTYQSDRIIEGAGTNVIFGSHGDDLIEVRTGIGLDAIYGGPGINTIDWSGSSQSGGTYDLAAGEARAGGQIEIMLQFQNFIGTGQRDLIIESGAANDIHAGGGNDTIYVTSTIVGDTFNGGFDNDTIDWSGSGESGGVFDLSGGTATNAAGTETEIMFGFENFVGTAQNDILIEGAGINEIDMGDGNDEVRVNTSIGGDAYRGGNGLDLIDWSALDFDGGRFDLANGFARLGATAREDMVGFESFLGTQGDDRIFGSAVDNGLRGMGGDDIISGRNGFDRIYGGDGDDFIRGQGGHDDLIGDDGDDRLVGNAGNDQIFGGAGRDRLIDGEGGDMLTGGRNEDVFVLITDGATDRIADFEIDIDRILLAGYGYDDLRIADLANGNVRVRYADDTLILVDMDGSLMAAGLTESHFLF